MLKDIDRQMKQVLMEMPSAPYLLSIPGVGPLSAAVFLGELGNPAYFHNARQIVKYAGYDPQERGSGAWVSWKFISNKGHWLMRKYLFFMRIESGGAEQILSGLLSEETGDKKQGGSAAQEKRDPLCGGNKADQSDLRALTG